MENDIVIGREMLATAPDGPGAFYYFDIENRGWFVNSGADEQEFNVGMISMPDPKFLQHIFDTLQSSGLPFEIWVPDQILTDLQIDLSRNNLEYSSSFPYMVLDKNGMENLNLPDTQGPEVVDTLEKLKQAVALHILVFGFDESIANTMGEMLLANPNVKTLLLYEQSHPVSSAMAVIDPETNTAGIWNVVTDPKKQKQGLGTKIMISLIKELESQGVESIHLLATEEGKKMYQNLGFEERYTIHTFSKKSAESNPQ